MSEHLRTDLVLETHKNVPVLYALATMIALNTVVWNPNLKKLSPHQRVAMFASLVLWCVSQHVNHVLASNTEFVIFLCEITEDNRLESRGWEGYHSKSHWNIIRFITNWTRCAGT